MCYTVLTYTVGTCFFVKQNLISYINKNKELNTCLTLRVIPLLGEMSAKQTKGCPFPEEKVAAEG